MAPGVESRLKTVLAIAMKLGRFFSASHPFPRVGLTLDDTEVLDLSGVGVQSLSPLLDDPNLVAHGPYPTPSHLRCVSGGTH
jgi:hypothetical protein